MTVGVALAAKQVKHFLAWLSLWEGAKLAMAFTRFNWRIGVADFAAAVRQIGAEAAPTKERA
jgi:hypothetical protein